MFASTPLAITTQCSFIITCSRLVVGPPQSHSLYLHLLVLFVLACFCGVWELLLSYLMIIHFKHCRSKTVLLHGLSTTTGIHLSRRSSILSALYTRTFVWRSITVFTLLRYGSTTTSLGNSSSILNVEYHLNPRTPSRRGFPSGNFSNRRTVLMSESF